MPDGDRYSAVDVATPRTQWGTTVVAIARDLRSLTLELPETSDTARLRFDERPFKVRVAASDTHRGAATMLIHRMYAWRGYKTTPLASDPNRLTLVASADSRHVGTISIGFDSPVGLLVDDLYHDEVQALRDGGAKVCETVKLAVDGKTCSKRVLASLFHIAVIYAYRVRQATDMLIEIHPRHVMYYERLLGFAQRGPQRLNRRVNAPAVLLGVSLKDVHEQIRCLGDRINVHVKSLLPYFFAPADEERIVRRLSTMS